MSDASSRALALAAMLLMPGCQAIFGIQELTFDGVTDSGMSVHDAGTGRDAGTGPDSGNDSGKRDATTDATVDATADATLDASSCNTFTVTASPATLTLYEQVPATLTIMSGGCATFDNPIAVSLGPLPAGVRASVPSVVLDRSAPSAALTLTAALGITYTTDGGSSDAGVPLVLQAVAVGAAPVTATVSLNLSPLHNGLDRTFGEGGVAPTAPVDDLPGVIESIAINASNEVVFAGDDGSGGGSGFIVGRYSVTGTPNLGMNSPFVTSFREAGAGAAAVAVPIDASVPLLWVAGNVDPEGTENVADEFAVARYHETSETPGQHPGDLDTSFGDAGGTVLTRISFSTQVAAAVLDPQNRYLVVGNDPDGNVNLVRYLASGAYDPNFASGHMSIQPIPATSLMFATGVALTADGHIIVVGGTIPSSSAIVIARLYSDGGLDTSFGAPAGSGGGALGGVVITPTGESSSTAEGVALDGDGNIYVCGTTFYPPSNRFLLAKYTASGALDTSFGDAGVVVTALGSTDDEAAAVAVVSANGTRIVVAGTTREDTAAGQVYGVGLVRYIADGGALDPTFGYDGSIRSIDETSFNQVHALAIDRSGNIVVGGSRRVGSIPEPFVARYRAQ